MINFQEFLGLLFVACPLLVFGTVIMPWGIRNIFHFTRYDR